VFSSVHVELELLSHCM